MIEITDEKNLKKSLKSGYKKLYYICGSDEYVIDRCVSTIVGLSDVLRMKAGEMKWSALDALLFSYSFGSERSYALISDFSVSSKKSATSDDGEDAEDDSSVNIDFERLAMTIGDISDNATLIITTLTDPKSVGIKKKVESLLNNCDSVTAVLLKTDSEKTMIEEIISVANEHGTTCSASVASILAARCFNVLNARNEVAKLCAYCGYTEITTQAIDAMCEPDIDDYVFNMITAVERGNIKKALTVLDGMIAEKQPALRITATVNNSYLNILRAKSAQDCGQGLEEYCSEFGYKKNDKKTSIAFDKARRYSTEKLDKIISILYDIDNSLKGGSLLSESDILKLGFIKIASL